MARSEAPASAKAAGNSYPLCLPPPRQSSTLHESCQYPSYSDENVEYVIEQGARMHTPDTMAATVSRPVFATC